MDKLLDFPGSPEIGDDSHYVMVGPDGRVEVEYWCESATGMKCPVLLVPLEEAFASPLQKVFWAGAARIRRATQETLHRLDVLASHYRQQAADHYGCEPWEIEDYD